MDFVAGKLVGATGVRPLIDQRRPLPHRRQLVAGVIVLVEVVIHHQSPDQELVVVQRGPSTLVERAHQLAVIPGEGDGIAVDNRGGDGHRGKRRALHHGRTGSGQRGGGARGGILDDGIDGEEYMDAAWHLHRIGERTLPARGFEDMGEDGRCRIGPVEHLVVDPIIEILAFGVRLAVEGQGDVSILGGGCPHVGDRFGCHDAGQRVVHHILRRIDGTGSCHTPGKERARKQTNLCPMSRNTHVDHGGQKDSIMSSKRHYDKNSRSCISLIIFYLVTKYQAIITNTMLVISHRVGYDTTSKKRSKNAW